MWSGSVLHHSAHALKLAGVTCASCKGDASLTGRVQADRSLESLYAELVSNSIIRPCPARPLQDYLGTVNLLGSVLQAQGLIPDPSCAQMRQVLTQYCIYPLASRYCHLK